MTVMSVSTVMMIIAVPMNPVWLSVTKTVHVIRARIVVFARMSVSVAREENPVPVAATVFVNLEVKIACPVLVIVPANRRVSRANNSAVVTVTGIIRLIVPTRAAPVESLNVVCYHSLTAAVTASSSMNGTDRSMFPSFMRNFEV